MMITVKVWAYRKIKYFSWRQEVGSLGKAHHLFNHFSEGKYKVSVRRDFKKGEYKYLWGTEPHLYFETNNGRSLLICPKFAKVALGKGKKFVVGAYYSLSVKKIEEKIVK